MQTLAIRRQEDGLRGLGNLPAIEVQMTGGESLSEQAFYSDLADAVIAAIDLHDIHP